MKELEDEIKAADTKATQRSTRYNSEKLERWIILMVECVTILHYYRAKWLHIPPLE